MDRSTPRLIVVSGLSGSGKSIALDVLEDAGYNCIDNLPLPLFETLAHDLARNDDLPSRTAVGIDARAPCRNLGALPRLLADLRASGIACELLFLSAENEVLIRRFSETRRRHPLTDEERGGDLEAAIERERRLLAPLREAADLEIDTTRTTFHQLRELIRERVARRPADALSILIKSFGFKHGVPRNANFVFDARCLPNPHWDPELRPLTGRDAAVIRFLEAHEEVDRMRADIERFLRDWIPRFEAEGRAYLTIAIGCTGGRHRSVYLVERIGRALHAAGHRVLRRHRELP